jgi:hypothetical protein
VGWANNQVVEADCYSECELTEEHLPVLQRRNRPPAGEWLSRAHRGSISNVDRGFSSKAGRSSEAAFSNTHAKRAEPAVPDVTPTGAPLGVAGDVTPAC